MSVKTILLPNGIWKESKKNLGLQNNYKNSNFKVPYRYILFVGRLSIVKGPDILLDAFTKSKIKDDYSLIFAGPDENMKNNMLKHIKKSFYRDKIFFLGSVNPEKRDFLMKNATLTVIPSRKEAMSMVALETSLMGTAFLATNCCGLDEFEANSSGFICKSDPESLSNKLNNLLKDINLIKEVGKNAKNYVLTFYTWESIIEKMNLCLNNLIEK